MAVELLIAPDYHEISSGNLRLIASPGSRSEPTVLNFYLPGKNPHAQEYERYLSQEKICVLEGGEKHCATINLEHIVPRSVCDEYNRSLGFLAGHPANHARICRDCHNKIDNNHRSEDKTWVEGKAAHFLREGNEGGLYALFQYLSDKYPRASQPDFFERQHRQWCDLFALVYTHLPKELLIVLQEMKDLKRYYPPYAPEERTLVQRFLKTELVRIPKTHSLVGSRLILWKDINKFVLPTAA